MRTTSIGYLRWKKKRTLLNEKETTWRLKSKALWLEKGDYNTKYFYFFANHGKMQTPYRMYKAMMGK